MRTDKKTTEEDTVFMGLRVSKNIHQRLYRAKARLELNTGKFYGMGRLLDRVLKIGLSKIERDMSGSSGASATV